MSRREHQAFWAGIFFVFVGGLASFGLVVCFLIFVIDQIARAIF